jgi:hypothetical protein
VSYAEAPLAAAIIAGPNDPSDCREPTLDDQPRPNAPSASDGPTAEEPPQLRDEAPGLREQLSATRAGVMRLVSAHVDLAKAEFSEIGDEIKGVAMLGGIAFGLLVLVGFLLPIGLTLFVGEWVFGSIGWGLLHGTEFFVALALACVYVAIGLGAGSIARDFLIGAVVAIVVGLLLGLDLTNQAWTRLGESLAVPVEPGIRPLVVGAAGLAIVGGIIGLVGGVRGGIGAAIGGLLGGAILGAIAGAISAIALGPRVGAAIGVAIGLAVWMALDGVAMMRRGFDTDALKARFWPDETIQTTKETIEWVRERTPLGPRS